MCRDSSKRRNISEALWISRTRRARNCGLVETITVNSAVRGRRLASPVRLALASELGGDLDGAWWPHTASIANELPELTDALFTRLGPIVDIGVNWSSLAGSPDLDPLYRSRAAEPGPMISPQRLMTFTGSKASAKLLVVPSRTSVTLAVMVLRHAADLPVGYGERDTQTFRTADDVVRAARAECAQRTQHLGGADATCVGTPDSATV